MSRNEVYCSLESLPADILLAFLSAPDSLADLHAFIRSSPWLYKVFLASKRAILLNFVSKDAGPVIRDYAALSLTPPLNPNQANYHASILDAVRKYQELPAGSKATVGITIEQVLEIIRVQRTVHFFVDRYYEYTRLRLLAKCGADTATPLSPHERQRLCRAFVRHRLFTRLYPWPARDPASRQEEGREFFGLFEAWEIEQVSVANAFIFSLIKALHVLHRGCCDRVLSRILGLNICPHEGRYTDDPGALRCRIVSLAKTDAEFMGTLREYLRHRGTDQHASGVWGRISSLDWSHAVVIDRPAPGNHQALLEILDGRKSLYDTEMGRPRLSAGTSCGEPPFGWVSAMRGLNCCRWGASLATCFCVLNHGPSCRDGWELRRQWRQLGFVFWDKGRIERLYEHSCFVPGWLDVALLPPTS